MKLKCPLLLNMDLKKNLQNYWSFYPSEPFKNGHFNVRYPVQEKEAQTEIEYKVDHERIKEPKELQEKEDKTANQKLKLSTKLGSLPRVQPINRSSIMKGEKISRGIFMSSQHSINEFKHCLQI